MNHRPPPIAPGAANAPVPDSAEVHHASWHLLRKAKEQRVKRAKVARIGVLLREGEAIRNRVHETLRVSRQMLEAGAGATLMRQGPNPAEPDATTADVSRPPKAPAGGASATTARMRWGASAVTRPSGQGAPSPAASHLGFTPSGGAPASPQRDWRL